MNNKGLSMQKPLRHPDYSFLITHPWSFNTPCQKRGFGVKSPSVFETMAIGAFSRERNRIGWRPSLPKHAVNNLCLALKDSIQSESPETQLCGS